MLGQEDIRLAPVVLLGAALTPLLMRMPAQDGPQPAAFEAIDARASGRDALGSVGCCIFAAGMPLPHDLARSAH